MQENRPIKMNLPAPFIESTRALLGNEAYEKLATALQQEPPTSIRLNEDKFHYPLSTIHYPLIPWASQGYYLDERLTFTFDPLFHAGCYYVQEASSMFVEQVLKQYVTESAVMLDLCAAPGGKSTHARSVLPEGSLLVANEVIRNRSQILAENLTKWGHPDVVVTNNDPVDFSELPSFFDVILTDVPCSGEGMFRKDPVAIEEWSPENVEICWQRQRRIIIDIWPSLKPGGILIYSTCTYNIKEDEENIRWMQEEFGAESLPLETQESWNITGNLIEGDTTLVYHFLPHKTKGEGFFLAALRKPETGEEPESYDCSFSKKKKMKEKAVASSVSKENVAAAKSWIAASDEYVVAIEENTIVAFSQSYVNELSALKRYLRVIQAGMTIGEVKGKDLIPDHSLAMSRMLRPTAFPLEELSYGQAIAYLRKEAITLPLTAPRGYVMVTYKQIPLGFVKNIGNRANNLYPQEWRIRSGYLPEKVLTLLGEDEL